jgi:anaerobic selenocysteine-containing dehydrogenase
VPDHYRTCPLCEATCGLELHVEDHRVTRIRGDREDVFSAGFICPKGSALHRLQDDPDRLQRPLVRRDGELVETDWPEAFAEIDARLRPIIEEHGRDAVAVYLGNPNVHTLSGQLYNRAFVKALGTRNIFSASTVDQMPKHVSAGLMFGSPLSIPVPDIDRTDHLLVLGANPKASNGSLATAADWPGKMTAIRERGGRVVVVDPRRTESAELADEHLFIRPGTDAAWLAAVATVILSEGLADPGPLAGITVGLDEIEGLLAAFTPESVAATTGIEADTTRRIARDLASAPTAAVYGRIGTHAGTFGTLASWIVDVLNVITGNLDRPGGAMFARASTERPRRRAFRIGRWESRAAGHPEVMSELPVATLADEILTPGEGQVKALVTIAGNPLRSTPDTGRLTEAIEGLELVVSVDPYLGETAARADVVLPPPGPLQKAHFDLSFQALAVRNHANWSEPVFPLEPHHMPEWEILTRLALVAAGQGTEADVGLVDTWALAGQVQREVATPGSSIEGRDPQEIMTELGDEPGPARIVDFLVRVGPYGDGFGADPDGLTLSRLLERPHGIDLGALEPRLPELLCTESGRIELTPEWITRDLPRLEAILDDRPNGMVLIGRRQLQSNNSWMHNVDVLVKGRRNRCTLLITPADADRHGVSDGDEVTVTSDAGTVRVPIEVTEAMMPGVVSLPHGWGHDDPGTRLGVASRRPGVDSNRLTGAVVDPVSGNAVLNGIPVEIAAG